MQGTNGTKVHVLLIDGATEYDTLIVTEWFIGPLIVPRCNGMEWSTVVGDLVDHHIGWCMEAMVVTWCQVDDVDIVETCFEWHFEDIRKRHAMVQRCVWCTSGRQGNVPITR